MNRHVPFTRIRFAFLSRRSPLSTAFARCGIFVLAIGLLLLNASTVVAQTGCPLCPVPREYRSTGAAIPLGTPESSAIVLPETSAMPQNVVLSCQYAAERLQTLIQNRFHTTLPRLENSAFRSSEKEKLNLAFVLSIDPNSITDQGKSRANGFRIWFERSATPVSVHLQGVDAAGLIYACDAVFSLIFKDAEGAVQITEAEVCDWPSIPWRGRPHSVMAHQLAPGQLDAYVHARINFADYRDDIHVAETLAMPARKASMGCPPGQPVDAELAQKVLAECHRRGIYVYGVASCNLPEGRYGLLTQTFDELLALGCDGIWISMDDTGGGADPVQLAEYVAKYLRKKGLKGHDALFTPGLREYTTIERPLNRRMAQIETFNEATWIFTRVPCADDARLAREIGLKNKIAWWFNYCETSYPDPKAGFIHSSAILTTQRKDGRPSYVNLLPLAPGWGSPEFDAIRDAAQYVDHVNLWALCGGWPSEYAVVMFGHWAWNPENCDWPHLRDSIYSFVWGPGQIQLARSFDETFAELKTLYLLPRNWSFRTPDNGLVRLKSPENRARALEILDALDKMAAELAQKAPAESALDAERLEFQYLEPMRTSLRFARLQAKLDYPEYEFANFEQTAAVLAQEEGEETANAYLARVHQTVSAQIAALSDALQELKDVEPTLDLWRARLAVGKTMSERKKAELEKRKEEWEMLTRLNVKEFFPFLENPVEGNFVALFDSLDAPANDPVDAPSKPENSETIQSLDANVWKTEPSQTTGPYRVGMFRREGLATPPLAAIMVPRHAKTRIGDTGWIETTLNLDTLAKNGERLYAELFVADTRIDRKYQNVRKIEILVNGKNVWSRDLADPNAKERCVFPLERASENDPSCRIQFRVTELKEVSDHASWIFVGPMRVLKK